MTVGAIDLVIEPHVADLGDGFTVRRALPFAKRRSVGPFVFFDRVGPVRFAAGKGLDVRPHPHIGLATVTYLFDGEILHRDSLGTVQAIRPGAVNWMTAGRGIAHSERTPQERRGNGDSLAGVQLWAALPKPHEETAASFSHHPVSELPLCESEGAEVRVIAGSFLGARSPVATISELFCADATLPAGSRLELPAEHEERGFYILSGGILMAGESFAPERLVVLRPGTVPVLAAEGETRLLLLGGAALDGPRHIWWNFVSSSKDRIEKAKADWKEGRFALVPGESDFIPLPE